MTYLIDNTNNPSEKNFILAFDDYHLFWTESNYYLGSRNKYELGSKDLAEMIWKEWLENVGIL